MFQRGGVTRSASRILNHLVRNVGRYLLHKFSLTWASDLRVPRVLISKLWSVPSNYDREGDIGRRQGM